MPAFGAFAGGLNFRDMAFADLFGEVKLNFVSETLPLDKLADAAKVALVQRNSPVGHAAATVAPPEPVLLRPRTLREVRAGWRSGRPAPAPAASPPREPAGGVFCK